MKYLDVVAAILLVIGGLNWGVVALTGGDLVTALLGATYAEPSALSRLVYLLVGLAAVYQAAMVKGIQKRWRVATA